LFLMTAGFHPAGSRYKILVVSSYHPEYLWSQETNKGLTEAFLQEGFFDNREQIKKYSKNHEVETSKAVFKKIWMDTKRKSSKEDIASAAEQVVRIAKTFFPDIILLGDDNAANYIGNTFIDTKTPLVFWGVNGYPLKYNLMDSTEKPGHNVTGIYQAGYYRESLEFLKEIKPEIKTFAILSDDTETGRSKAKMIEALSRQKKLPLILTETIVTNDFEEWKARAFEAQKTVDAFFVLNHQGLRYKSGKPVDMLTAGAWYLKNITKAECSDEKQNVEEGMLLAVDDSGYNQGFEAAKMAVKILNNAASPQTTASFAPQPGPRVVNSQRLKQLGLTIKPGTRVEQYIEKSLAVHDGS